MLELYLGLTSRVLSEGSRFHGDRMLSLPNLHWGRREDVSTSRRGRRAELAGRALCSAGAGPGAGEADSFQPIPMRQRQEGQLCGRHRQVAQEGGALASPPQPPVRGEEGPRRACCAVEQE